MERETLQRWNPEVLLLFPAPTIRQIYFGRCVHEFAFPEVDTSDGDHLSVGKNACFRGGK